MEKPFPGCSQTIGQAYTLAVEGISAPSLRVILASLAPATLKQYARPIKLWWEFCQKKEISPFEPPTSSLLEFLTLSLEGIKTYGTLNSYRSAIALIINRDIGNDPIIKRFCKGAANLKPQSPRYDFTWDPMPVLVYLKSLYPNEKISLKDLSYKLVTLLALATAQRQQTMTLMKLSNIVQQQDAIHIKISDRVKTSGVNRKQPLLTLPFFKDQTALCVASALLSYIERTSKIRPKGTDRILISFRKPHEPCSAQTLSRWIRTILSKSGIDTKVFTSYSIKHAATSAALRNGVSLDVIRKTACWSDSSRVFALFYNRPVLEESNFAQKVLS